MSAPFRTPAAHTALLALLRAIPPDGALWLAEDEPAIARIGANRTALGRAPLSRVAIDLLLAAPELAEAVQRGPGTRARWPVQVGERWLDAAFFWPADGKWGVALGSSLAVEGAVTAGVAEPTSGLPPLPPPLPPPPTGPPASVAPPVAPLPAIPAPKPPARAAQFSPAVTESLQALQAPAASEAPRAAPPSPSKAEPAPPLVLSAAAGVEAECGLPPRLLSLLQAAREKRASDLHVQTDQPPRHRVAGRLLAAGDPIAAGDVDAFVVALLSPALKESLAARGSVDLALAAPPHGRFRLNVGREASGFKLCFRLLPDAPASLSALAVPAEVEAVASYHQGLAVFAGPRGHGKTTTMSAIVNLINERSACHILTVEDPIEVVHAQKKAVVSQREVGRHTRSFPRALKAALREDPDIIVIGELRDRQTVEIALSAAETGHLVLATMSTRSAAKTVDRLIDLFPPEEQPQVRATLAGALKMIVSQRLLPKRNGELTPAVEIVTGSVPLWTLIRENKMHQLPSLQQRGKSIGMLRFDASLEALVAAGEVEPSQAHAAAENPAELLRVLHDKHGYTPVSAPAAAKE